MTNLNTSGTSMRTLSMVQLALFSGIIVVMAFTPFVGYIPLGFTRATIIHIPVIIGSLMLGPKKGAFLGGVFGMTSLINNTVNPTPTSFIFSPFVSIGEMDGSFASLVICMVPRILVGIVPFYVYKLAIGRKSEPTRTRSIVGLSLAGVLGSLTNTLLVMNLIFLFFKDAFAQANNVASDAVYKFILGIIGMNGVPEAIVAGVIVTGIGLAISKTKFAIK